MLSIRCQYMSECRGTVLRIALPYIYQTLEKKNKGTTFPYSRRDFRFRFDISIFRFLPNEIMQIGIYQVF